MWGKAVSVPGRALAPVIARLAAAGMPEADHAALAGFHAKVVASLTGGGGGGDGAEQVDGQLEAALPGLKRLAGIGGGGVAAGSAGEVPAGVDAGAGEGEAAAGGAHAGADEAAASLAPADAGDAE